MTAPTIAGSPASAGSSVSGDRDAVATSMLLGRLERIPLSRWHLKVRGVIGTATFFDGVDFLALSMVLPVLVRLWHLTPVETGLLISSSIAGNLVGVLSFSALAERFGRIPAVGYATLLIGIGGVGCALSTGYTMLLCARFVQGIGMGAEVPVAAAYINEIAPTRNRGRFVLLYEFVFALGVLAAGLIGRWCIPHFGWESMFVIGAVPALLIAPFIFRLPESPRWLVAQGRLDDADAALLDIEHATVRAGLPLAEPTPSAPSIIAKGTYKELFVGGYSRRTLFLVLVCFCLGSLAWPLTSWMPTLFTSVYKVPLETALTYGMITTSCAIVAGTLICSLLIDMVGRRRWFIFAFGLAAAALVILGVTGAQLVLLVVVFASLAMFAVSSMNLAFYVYAAELFPTRLRAIGIGTTNAMSRVAGILAPPAVGWLLAHHGIAAVFVLLSVFGVAGAIVTLVMGEETRRRVLEEISA